VCVRARNNPRHAQGSTALRCAVDGVTVPARQACVHAQSVKTSTDSWGKQTTPGVMRCVCVCDMAVGSFWGRGCVCAHGVSVCVSPVREGTIQQRQQRGWDARACRPQACAAVLLPWPCTTQAHAHARAHSSRGERALPTRGSCEVPQVCAAVVGALTPVIDAQWYVCVCAWMRFSLPRSIDGHYPNAAGIVRGRKAVVHAGTGQKQSCWPRVHLHLHACFLCFGGAEPAPSTCASV
jgi:hypothetical protein